MGGLSVINQDTAREVEMFLDRHGPQKRVQLRLLVASFGQIENSSVPVPSMSAEQVGSKRSNMYMLSYFILMQTWMSGKEP